MLNISLAGVKLPNTSLFDSNIKLWEEQLLAFLLIHDLDQFILKHDDTEEGREEFVFAYAIANNPESSHKARILFKKSKKQAAELIWSCVPKIEQKEILNSLEEDLEENANDEGDIAFRPND